MPSVILTRRNSEHHRRHRRRGCRPDRLRQLRAAARRVEAAAEQFAEQHPGHPAAAGVRTWHARAGGRRRQRLHRCAARPDRGRAAHRDLSRHRPRSRCPRRAQAFRARRAQRRCPRHGRFRRLERGWCLRPDRRLDRPARAASSLDRASPAARGDRHAGQGRPDRRREHDPAGRCARRPAPRAGCASRRVHRDAFRGHHRLPGAGALRRRAAPAGQPHRLGQRTAAAGAPGTGRPSRAADRHWPVGGEPLPG